MAPFAGSDDGSGRRRRLVHAQGEAHDGAISGPRRFFSNQSPFFVGQYHSRGDLSFSRKDNVRSHWLTFNKHKD